MPPVNKLQNIWDESESENEELVEEDEQPKSDYFSLDPAKMKTPRYSRRGRMLNPSTTSELVVSEIDDEKLKKHVRIKLERIKQ